ncbi:MAG: hypothetical protein KAI79_16530 [Bacteroidales bacterium]|nr:hypothetical protein [Bacteroidales bacterium]
MSLSIPFLLAFALTLPGIVFRHAYKRGRYAEIVSRFSILEEILFSIPFSILLHYVMGVILKWIIMVNPEFIIRIHCNELITLMNGNYTSETIIFFIKQLIIYFIVVLFLSAFLGKISHYLIRYFRLDKSLKVFRFSRWFYLLRGEAIELPEFNEDGLLKRFLNRKKYDKQFNNMVVLLGVTVDFQTETYLYRGAVHDFHFDNNGDLKELLLKHVIYRNLKDNRLPNEESKDRYVKLRADFLKLRFKDIKTLSIEYIFFKEETTSDSDNLLTTSN